jgi:alpha-glucoside transport system permease protein
VTARLDAPVTAPANAGRQERSERPHPPRRRAVARWAVRAGGSAVRVLLVLVALFWMFPVLGLLVASLRPESRNASSGWWTALTEPAQLTLDNYAALLTDAGVLRALGNTLLIAVPSTVLVVVLGALAAHALAWVDFRGRGAVLLGVAALLVVPVQVALIPIARLFGDLGIYGSILGVVLFHTAFGLPFAVFLLRNYFAAIPRDLLEAARLDGGRELAVFRRVVVPLSTPAFAALAVFQFLWVWNDLLVALVFADRASAPITVALRSELRQFGGNIDVLASGAFLSMVVPLAVFFACHRHVVNGVLAGVAR